MNFHLNVMNLAIYFKTPFSPSVDRILRYLETIQDIWENDDVIWFEALINHIWFSLNDIISNFYPTLNNKAFAQCLKITQNVSSILAIFVQLKPAW